MDVDPLASMRCWAITLTLGGREYEIPALPAVDWWPVLVEANPAALLDIIPSSSDLDSQLLSGEVGAADLTEALTDAIEEATGRTMHAAYVLATVATMHWSVIGGQMAQRGFRWDVLSIGAALDAVYATIVAGMSEENSGKFLALLENEALTRPGKKRAPSKRIIDEFESMAGPRPAPAPVPGRSSAEPSGSERPKTRTRPRQPRQGGRSGAPRQQPEPPG